MSVLLAKTRRDLARQRWQHLSIGVTVLLGVALFAASYDAFQNLEASYRQTYDRLAFADLTVTGGDTSQFAEMAASERGVAAVTSRAQSELPFRVGGDHKLLGRLVELPAGADTVNRLDILAGSEPGDIGGPAVAVERHMADHFDLAPGSTLDVYSGGRWRSVEVSGVAVSPEYLWPARSRQDLLTTPDNFGVVFAPPALFDQLVPDGTHQALVRFDPEPVPPDLVSALTHQAQASGATSVEIRADQPSNAALQEDVAGFGELSLLFPALFLGAAAMATFVLLGRLVRSQRGQIATLAANGLSTRQIVLHYLGEGVMVTGSAGLVGLALGVPLGRMITGLYTDAISVPDTVTEFHPETLLVGLVLALLTGLVAAGGPASAAARIAPGEALRGLAPTGHGGRSALEKLLPPVRHLPARWRMVLRGIARDRRRSLSTMSGVVLSLILILSSWGMVDTVDILVDRQFNHIQRQDAQLYLESAEPGLRATVEGAPGVERAEPVVEMSVLVGANGERYTTQLIAFEKGTRMHDFGGVMLPESGFVAGRSLGSILGVRVGDELTATVPGTGESLAMPVVAFVDEPLGTLIYASQSAMSNLSTGTSTPSIMVTFVDGADSAQMRSDLSDLPGVVAYIDSRGLYDTAQGFLSLFYAFVGVMLAFGGLMSFALLFNTASVNAAERASELAAMEANGASPAQLTRLLAGENLLLTVLAIGPGLAVGYWFSALFMDSFSSDLFDFGLEMRTTTMIWSALAILVVSALAQLPAGRALARLDVASVVRERSQ